MRTRPKRQDKPVVRINGTGQITGVYRDYVTIKVEMGNITLKTQIFKEELRRVPKRLQKEGLCLRARLAIEFVPPITAKEARALAKELKRRFPDWEKSRLSYPHGKGLAEVLAIRGPTPHEAVDPTSASQEPPELSPRMRKMWDRAFRERGRQNERDRLEQGEGYVR